MRLLVVEDDRSIGEPLRTGLQREGFEVDLVTTGAEALAAPPADLVLLDLGLPDLDGATVCRRLRAVSAVPIIVVTARGDEIDRVLLLDLGADDYVVKPFGIRELAARVRAVLRRTANATTDPGARSAGDDRPVVLGPLAIDHRAHRVTLHGRDVALTPREYDLLVYLARDPGMVVTRETIMRDVWDENWWGSTRTLDVHVASLRKKLGPDAIRTVRGVGFTLDAGARDGGVGS